MDLPVIEGALRDWVSPKTFIGRLWIYGSRARDDFRPESDLDVAIEITGRIKGLYVGYSAFCRYRKDWAEELQAVLPYTIHLAHYDPDTEPDLPIADGNIVAAVARSNRLVFERSHCAA